MSDLEQKAASELVSFWDGVPSIEGDAAVASEGLYARFATRYPVSRRTALKGAVTVGGAFALTILGALPPGRPRAAKAAVGSEWLSCAGYARFPGYWPVDDRVCVQFDYQYYYCHTDGWFRWGDSGAAYYNPVSFCGSGNSGFYGKNAWQWPHGSGTFRCADGQVQPYGYGAVYKICVHRVA